MDVVFAIAARRRIRPQASSWLSAKVSGRLALFYIHHVDRVKYIIIITIVFGSGTDPVSLVILLFFFLFLLGRCSSKNVG